MIHFFKEFYRVVGNTGLFVTPLFLTDLALFAWYFWEFS